PSLRAGRERSSERAPASHARRGRRAPARARRATSVPYSASRARDLRPRSPPALGSAQLAVHDHLSALALAERGGPFERTRGPAWRRQPMERRTRRAGFERAMHDPRKLTGPRERDPRAHGRSWAVRAKRGAPAPLRLAYLVMRPALTGAAAPC